MVSPHPEVCFASTEDAGASTNSSQFTPKVEDVGGVEANLTTLRGAQEPRGTETPLVERNVRIESGASPVFHESGIPVSRLKESSMNSSTGIEDAVEMPIMVCSFKCGCITCAMTRQPGATPPVGVIPTRSR